MTLPPKKCVCPLCGSSLEKSRYQEIAEEREKLEKRYQDKLTVLEQDARQWALEKKQIMGQMKKEREMASRSTLKQEREKNRLDKMARVLQGKTIYIQELNKVIRDLREQLEKGTGYL